MLRALASRQMLGGLALAVVFAAVCVLLGGWQWGRHEDRQGRAEAVTQHYTAAPVPLVSVASSLPPAEDDEWVRVTATGQYAPGRQLLVRNRALDGRPGQEVLAPLALGDPLLGYRLVVDRGWVANADSAAQLPSVPPVPAGEVTVTGWLRRGEPDLGKDLPVGQLASIDPGEVAAQTGANVLDAYLVLGSEAVAGGATPARPAPLAVPSTDLGPHQAYAFQWWLTSLFGFVLVGYRLRMAAAERAPERAAVAPRPKKVRIWDEEDA